MKIIPQKYECEVCSSIYEDKEDALACEAKTVPEYKVGTLYGDNTKGAFYSGMTFCVAENSIKRHSNYGGSWACRDNHAGDSLGKHLCGTGDLHLGKHDAKLDQTQPNFKRMVAWLKEANIPIYIWDGEKSVPFVEA